MKTLTMDILTLIAKNTEDWKERVSQIPPIFIACQEQVISEQELRSYLYFLEIDMFDPEVIEYLTGFFSATHASEIITVVNRFEEGSLIQEDNPNYMDGLLNESFAEYKAVTEFNAQQLRDSFTFPE